MQGSPYRESSVVIFVESAPTCAPFPASRCHVTVGELSERPLLAAPRPSCGRVSVSEDIRLFRNGRISGNFISGVVVVMAQPADAQPGDLGGVESGKPKSEPQPSSNDGVAAQDEAQGPSESLEYRKKLVDCVLEQDPPIIDFKALSRINILHQQLELRKLHEDTISRSQPKFYEKWKWASTDQPFPQDCMPAVDMERLDVALHKYSKFPKITRQEISTFSYTATAIRDYEYMDGINSNALDLDENSPLVTMLETFPSRSGFPNPRNRLLVEMIYGALEAKGLPRSTVSHDPFRNWLQKVLPRWVVYEANDFSHKYGFYKIDWKSQPILLLFVDRLARFIVAITGGLSLVVPMLIMRLHQNPTKSLITTSVAVVLFAAVVSSHPTRRRWVSRRLMRRCWSCLLGRARESA